MKTLNPAVARVLKRLHYPLDVILTCVRWYVAYPLSLRHLEGKKFRKSLGLKTLTTTYFLMSETNRAPAPYLDLSRWSQMQADLLGKCDYYFFIPR